MLETISRDFVVIHRLSALISRRNVVILHPEQLENHPIAVFILFDKINLEIHEFRRNFDDATRSERRRTIARWKARTFKKYSRISVIGSRVAMLDARKRGN